MLERIWNGCVRQLRLLAVLIAITVLTGTFWSYFSVMVNDADSPIAAVDGMTSQGAETHAWGDEVLASIHEHVVTGLPIRVANACGLGASSCFRCHNGKRAEEPANDPVKDPWHVQHKTVNNSCAGCHQGNPRLMKQDIAHTGLIANPRLQPATTCFSCHTSSNAQGLVDVYLKLTNKTGE